MPLVSQDSLKSDSFLSGVLQNSAWDLVKFSAALLFTSGLFVTAVAWVVAALNRLEPYRWYILFLAATGSSWAFLGILQRRHRTRPLFGALDFDFHILTKELSYIYLDKTKMIYRKRIKMMTLKPNLDRYHDKYRWTGRGNLKLTSRVKEHICRETVKRSIWRLYEIDFQKTLKKGEEIETELQWDLEDKEGVSVPFFSATIEEPTDLLIFNLELPEDLNVTQTICEESSHLGAKRPFSTDTEQLRRGKATWVVQRPKLLHHYEMRWLM